MGNRKRIFIDMDDTLCQFSKRYAEKRKSHPEIAYPQSQYGFFANLEPIPGAIEAYKTLEKSYDVFILTAPSYLNPLCYTEKRVWVEKHLGLETTPNLIICQRKEFLMGDYLIDDHFYPFEGKMMLFGSAEFSDWETVLKYFD
jgi:5'(3')-deoxyribonucleotidase